MKVPEGVLRCPKDCPERKPGCHDPEKCECWAAQKARAKHEREERWNSKCIYPQSWAQRGIVVKGGRKS